jgi:hypothetical protein
MLVQPVTHGAHSSWIDVVDPTRSCGDFPDQASLLEHLQMLRHGRAAYRQALREITHGSGSLGDALKDLASGRVTQSR